MQLVVYILSTLVFANMIVIIFQARKGHSLKGCIKFPSGAIIKNVSMRIVSSKSKEALLSFVPHSLIATMGGCFIYLNDKLNGVVAYDDTMLCNYDNEFIKFEISNGGEKITKNDFVFKVRGNRILGRYADKKLEISLTILLGTERLALGVSLMNKQMEEKAIGVRVSSVFLEKPQKAYSKLFPSLKFGRLIFSQKAKNLEMVQKHQKAKEKGLECGLSGMINLRGEGKKTCQFEFGFEQDKQSTDIQKEGEQSFSKSSKMRAMSLLGYFGQQSTISEIPQRNFERIARFCNAVGMNEPSNICYFRLNDKQSFEKLIKWMDTFCLIDRFGIRLNIVIVHDDDASRQIMQSILNKYCFSHSVFIYNYNAIKICVSNFFEEFSISNTASKERLESDQATPLIAGSFVSIGTVVCSLEVEKYETKCRKCVSEDNSGTVISIEKIFSVQSPAIYFVLDVDSDNHNEISLTLDLGEKQLNNVVKLDGHTIKLTTIGGGEFFYQCSALVRVDVQRDRILLRFSKNTKFERIVFVKSLFKGRIPSGLELEFMLQEKHNQINNLMPMRFWVGKQYDVLIRTLFDNYFDNYFANAVFFIYKNGAVVENLICSIKIKKLSKKQKLQFGKLIIEYISITGKDKLLQNQGIRELVIETILQSVRLQPGWYTKMLLEKISPFISSSKFLLYLETLASECREISDNNIYKQTQKGKNEATKFSDMVSNLVPTRENWHLLFSKILGLNIVNNVLKICPINEAMIFDIPISFTYGKIAIDITIKNSRGTGVSINGLCFDNMNSINLDGREDILMLEYF